MATALNIEGERQAFYTAAAAQNLAPLWRVLAGLVPREPTPKTQPHHWRYRDVRPFLMRACELIGTEEADRRVLVLENPGLTGQSKITQSLYAGLQAILPGELARPHRHSAAALRFVIDGHGALTSVNGEPTAMAPGDFVVTPSWTWHEHVNRGTEPVVWLDGLDIHLVNLLDAGFREDTHEQPPLPARPDGASYLEYGHNLLPMDAEPGRTTSPIFNYPYIRTREALAGIARFREIDPHAGFKLRYVNPVNGDWAIATIASWAQLLPRGFSTASYRSTDGTIHVVVEGAGHSIIGGVRFDWTQGDVFVVPSWASVTHHADGESVLFGASDRAVQEKLGLWRESRDAR